jgi:hypothetical protein
MNFNKIVYLTVFLVDFVFAVSWYALERKLNEPLPIVEAPPVLELARPDFPREAIEVKNMWYEGRRINTLHLIQVFPSSCLLGAVYYLEPENTFWLCIYKNRWQKMNVADL